MCYYKFAFRICHLIPIVITTNILLHYCYIIWTTGGATDGIDGIDGSIGDADGSFPTTNEDTTEVEDTIDVDTTTDEDTTDIAIYTIATTTDEETTDIATFTFDTTIDEDTTDIATFIIDTTTDETTAIIDTATGVLLRPLQIYECIYYHHYYWSVEVFNTNILTINHVHFAFNPYWNVSIRIESLNHHSVFQSLKSKLWLCKSEIGLYNYLKTFYSSANSYSLIMPNCADQKQFIINFTLDNDSSE